MEETTNTALTEGVVNPGETQVEAGVTPPGESAGDPQTDTKSDVETKVGAPETYADFEFPEGVSPHDEAVEKFKGLAKEYGLTQDAAQNLVNMQVELMQGFVNGQSEAWENLRKEWQTSAKSDKELGGANFNANLSVAKEALKQFGGPEFIKMLDETGVGDHPEMLRFTYRLGKAMKEDKVHVGGNPSGEKKSHADILYGT